MNKIFTLLIGMLVLSDSSKGQSQFGLKAGLNLADQNKATVYRLNQPSPEKQNVDPMVGYQLGIFYKARLHKQLLWSIETNFSLVGSGMTLTSRSGFSSYRREKLGYFELPLTLQYEINKLYFGAGPSIGLKLFSKHKYSDNFVEDIRHYKTIDAAANVLAGYNFYKEWDVNLRYSHSFVNLYDYPDRPPYNYPGFGGSKVINRFFNLSLLYTIKR